MISNKKFLFFSVVITLILYSCGTPKKIINPKNTINTSYCPKNIKIYEQTSRETLGPCEPSIAINPTNPNNIVAGSVLDYVHISNDGGQTWSTQKMTSKFGIWGDPTILTDSHGNFYYFHLSDPEGTNWNSKQILDRIVVQKSTDNGNTWTEGIGIGWNPPKQQDKQWALIDPTNEQHLYTAWTEFDHYKSHHPKDKSRILFSKSINAGQQWSTPIRISTQEGTCLDDDFTPEGTTLTSDRTNLYISWAYDQKIWFTKSIDHGNTWTKEVPIINQPNGWKYEIKGITRCNGFPVLGTDLSNSKHQGTLYINWSSQLNNQQTHIYISKSIDQGKTWSPPKTIHTTTTQGHHFFNWMSIDPKTGYIYVVYYKEHQPNSSLIDVYLAVSKNGAKTFKNYMISKQSFNPKGSNFFGDYNGISAYDGIIRPIWTQVKNGLVSVWTALVFENELE